MFRGILRRFYQNLNLFWCKKKICAIFKKGFKWIRIDVKGENSK